MRPTIRHGDLVLATRLGGRPRPGEAVVLQTPVGVVVHRVVGRTVDADGRAYYGTAGDANRRIDAFVVPGEMILGTVRARLPLLGLPHLCLANALTFLATRFRGRFLRSIRATHLGSGHIC